MWVTSISTTIRDRIGLMEGADTWPWVNHTMFAYWKKKKKQTRKSAHSSGSKNLRE